MSTNTLSPTDHEAIALFEKAVEKESIGLMSDAVQFYRRAFKLNEQVDFLYRQHKLPHLIKSLQLEKGKNSGYRLDENKVKSINVDTLLHQFKQLDIDEHYDKCDNGPSPLVYLPNDIWIHILEYLVDDNVESWFKMSITCKKFAYLGFASSSIWRNLCYHVYPKQVYHDEDEQIVYQFKNDEVLALLPQYDNSWKKLLTCKPFVKFYGCYISIVNYYSEGGRKEFSSTNLWSNPVKIITYYRYLRFYPNGDVIKVLSILPPTQVVSHLSRMNSSIPVTAVDHPANPAAAAAAAATPVPAPAPTASSRQDKKNQHKIYKGKWSMSDNGRIHIVLDQGSVPYYAFHYIFQIDTLGHINKHGKLSWLDYYAIRKKMHELDDDDRIGELSQFSLRNEKAFKFSRVRSYTLDN
ncbi:uncharacterized protein SPAPADRAFT_142902 [Spathaspora passalidarum NRRL Y-27907]|uniref:F-box domain-containing protein n=1 Tax=Spathaspora passalidarum (strain NRRL Y-27907 / 11-Y1) TaxID=619300 RepID=G3AT02_SPAPN|nr:uncharacterized protein SPAPADRAFT_142902 [Spathaspora passalidarum NRRL Y-27907]EGW30784.1 hypothetical protein SPAPADRAFT_142902 [Spathaspora passalidarum NRRL Y-27907]